MTNENRKPPSGRLHRLRKLAGMSARLGGGALLHGVKRLASRDKDEGLVGITTAERVVATLGELKGVAMKLGQTLSMDPDLMGSEARAIVARLQNAAPPMPYEEIERVVREELGAAPEERFGWFDPSPMAAASLGQVHRARTAGGAEVVVKVQYPGIVDALEADLDNLGSLVATVRQTTRVFDGSEYYAEMRAELLSELDYLREAGLAEEIRRAAAGLPDLVVPDVVEETTTRRVLTLSLVEGPTLGQALEAPLDDGERFRIARLLIRAVYGPFLAAGVIHADPHPGNFVIMPDGRLGLLDFGAVKRLSPGFHRAAKSLLLQAIRQEPNDVVAAARQMGFQIETSDAEASELLRAILHITGRPLRAAEYDYAQCEITWDLKKLLASNPLRLMKVRPPREMVMFLRAIGGLSQNLRLLKARGDFGAVYRELAELA